MNVEIFWALYVKHYSDVFIHSVYNTMSRAQEARKSPMAYEYDSIHMVYAVIVTDPESGDPPRVMVLGKVSDSIPLIS